MSDGLKIQGEVTFDTSKAEAALGNVETRADRMAKAVGQAGQAAATGLDAVTAGAEKSAQGFDRVTDRFIASVKKITTAEQAASMGGRDSIAFLEQRAQALGANAEAVQPYIRALQQLRSEQAALAETQKRAADAQLFEAQHAAAKRLVQDAEYVRFWTEALKDKERAEQHAAAGNDFVASLQQQANALGKTRADLLAMKAAQLGVTDAAAPYIAQLRAAEAQTLGLGGANRQLAFALRQVPMQMTDIVVSLASGQRPMQVLLQQGGQLKDVFGGIGPAARALGGYVAGMITPLTVAVATLGGLAYAAHTGAEEVRSLQNAVTVSGNALGQTSSQLAVLRENIGSIATQGKASETLEAIAAAGIRAGGGITEIAQAAILMEKATGQAVSKTIDQFKELERSPKDAALKLNEQYNFLTASILKQLDALEESGRKSEAAALAERTLASELKTRAQSILDNAGIIEKAWRAIGDGAKWAWDQMLGIGRPVTNTEKIATLQRQLEERQARNRALGIGDKNGDSAVTQQEKVSIDLLRENERSEKRLAELAAQRATQTQAEAAWQKTVESSLTKQEQLQRAITRVRQEGIAAGKSEAEIQQQVNREKQKYVETTGESNVAQQRAAKRIAEEENRRLQKSIDSLDFSTPTKLTDAEKKVIQVEEELKGSLLGKARASKVAELATARHAVESEQLRDKLEKQYAAVKASVEALHQQAAEMGKQAESINQQAAAQEAANAVFGKGKVAVEQLTLAQMELRKADLERVSDGSRNEAYLANLVAGIAAQKRLIAALQESNYKQVAQQQTEAARANAEDVKTLELQASLLGVTGNEREKILALRRIEVQLAKELADIDKQTYSSDATENERKRQELRTKAMQNAAAAASTEASRQIVDEMQRTADSVNNSLTDAGVQAFHNIEDAAGIARRTLVSMFDSLILRPTLQMALSPISGAIAQFVSGPGGILPTIGQTLGLGNVASSAAGFLGLGSSLAGASYAAAVPGLTSFGAGSQAAMLAAQTGEFGLAGLGATASAAGGSALGGVASALGAIPGWGWAALGVAAILGLSKKPGGPKEDGYYGLLDSDIGQGTRSSSAMQATKTAATALDQQYKALAKTFGFEAALQFGVAVSKDPKGTSPTFLEVAYGRDGKTVYSDVNLKVGRSDEELQAAMEAATANAMFAAIKSSKLEKPFADFFGNVADDASSEMKAAALKTATDVASYSLQVKYLGGVFDKITAMSVAARGGLIEVAGGLESLAQATATYYQNFYSAEEQRAVAIQQITAQLNAAGLQVTESQVGAATKAQFRQVVDSLDLTSEAGQRLFAALMNVSGAMASLIDSANGASAAAQQRYDLETQILEAQGNTAALRARELARIDPRNQDLQVQLYAIRDAQAANAAASKAAQQEQAAAAAAAQRLSQERQRQIEEENKQLQARQQAAEELSNTLKGVFDLLKDQVRELYGEIDGGGYSAAQGRQFIAQALATAQSTGYLPDQEQLSNAISAVRATLVAGNYTSRFEMERDRLVLAGQLAQLRDISGTQLSNTEQQLKTIEEQLKVNEEQLKVNQDAAESARSSAGSLSEVKSNTYTMAQYLKSLGDAVQAAIAAGQNPGAKNIAQLTGAAAQQSIASVLGPLTGVVPGLNGVVNALSTGGVLNTWQGDYYSASGGGALVRDNGTTRIYTPDGRQMTQEQFVAQMNTLLAAGNMRGVYDATRSAGLSLSTLDSLMGRPANWAEDFARSMGWGVFDVGTNRVPRDMFALVHEGEAIVPKAFNPWADGASATTFDPKAFTAGIDRLHAVMSDGFEKTRKELAKLNDTVARLERTGLYVRGQAPGDSVKVTAPRALPVTAPEALPVVVEA